jgi:flagellar FliL protein
MSNDDDGLDIDGGEISSQDAKTKKSKGLGGLLGTILKFAAIGLAAAILIVTITIITVRVVNKNGSTQTSTADPTSPYEGKIPEYAYYTLLGTINVKTKDVKDYTASINVILGYDLNDNAAGIELTNRQHQLRDFFRRYFSERTAAELKPENETRMKNDIKEILNTRYLGKARIRAVFFEKLDVMEVY